MAAARPANPAPTIRMCLAPVSSLIPRRGQPFQLGRQFGEGVDRSIRLRELVRCRFVGRLAPEHPDRPHPHELRGTHVVVESVPDHHRGRRVDAGRPGGELEEPRVGLAHTELVGDAPDLEERLEPVALHRRADLAGLVRDHPEPVPAPQRLETGDRVLVERGRRIRPVASGDPFELAEVGVREEPGDQPAPERPRLRRARPRVLLLELVVREGRPRVAQRAVPRPRVHRVVVQHAPDVEEHDLDRHRRAHRPARRFSSAKVSASVRSSPIRRPYRSPWQSEEEIATRSSRSATAAYFTRSSSS